MRSRGLNFAVLFAFLVLAFSASVQFAAGKKKEKIAAAAQMEEQKRAVHLLNRLTFGPRPGDISRVASIGIDKWIDEQLHPERINDSALEARLSPLRTLRMSTQEIVQNFPPPQVIKAVEQGKQSLPSDPVKRAVYESQMEKLDEKKEKKQQSVSPDDSEVPNSKHDDHMYGEAEAQRLLDLPPDQRIKEILKLAPEDRRALSASLKGPQHDQMLDGMNPQQRETLLALNNPQQVVQQELVAGKLIRATYSERQVLEVMTDFWFNHFNVFIGKGADRYLITSYERDVIRPHALGKFEDLLVATAQSPAMLFYLDNWLSVGPNSDVANGIPKNANKVYRKRYQQKNTATKQAKGKRNGLNENYGRELMELHTLGVNGGYTQKDVTEAARVLTGWTLKQPKEGGGFTFEQRTHEPGDKTVLGHRIKSSGEKEGLELLHLLAHHPSTAKFISTKLAMRFVSDNPPPSLVDRMAQTFLKKDGDIREVLKTMLQSPEFWAQGTYRAKIKTPLEFVVSSLRASGAEISDPLPLARALQNLGMPLYGMQPPTGYSMKADTWVNSAALLGRMNFALALTGGKLKGVQVDSQQLNGKFTSDSSATLAALENDLLEGDISRQTHTTIEAQIQDPKSKPDDPSRTGTIAGLLLGSPEFQRR